MKEIYLVIAGVDHGHSFLMGAFPDRDEAQRLLNELEFHQKVGVAPSDMPYRAKYFDYVYIHETTLYDNRKQLEDSAQEFEPIPPFRK
jgi:hypothetical protein